MECKLCGHPSTHKHGKAPNGSQRYFCPHCQQTFNERFDTMYYHRHVSEEQIRQVLQAHSEGSSLRGISRTSGLAYNTVVSLIRAASQKAQLVHNVQVQAVQTEEVSADTSTSSVQVNCGHLWKKTKVVTELCRSAMSPRRIRGGGLLDWGEFGEFQWIDFSCKSWQTYR